MHGQRTLIAIEETIPASIPAPVDGGGDSKYTAIVPPPKVNKKADQNSVTLKSGAATT